VGSGASRLLDRLLDERYTAVSALDISDAALNVSRERLAARADQITWLVGDVRTVALPPASFDLWHDRAVFHFLTDPRDRAAYVNTLRTALRPGGQAVIATFAEDGPLQCSGLDVVRYNAQMLAEALGAEFTLVESMREAHTTPWNSTQQFVHCRFVFGGA
jgi:SAM-dependent methyltransferase